MTITATIGSTTLTEEQVKYCLTYFSLKLEAMKEAMYFADRVTKNNNMLLTERLVDLFQDEVIVHPGHWPMEDIEPGQSEMLYWHDLRNSKWQKLPITVNGLSFPPYYILIFKNLIFDMYKPEGLDHEVGNSIRQLILEYCK